MNSLMVLRALYAIALAAIPALLMRKDGLKVGMFACTVALVGCAFSGGIVVAAASAVALLAYQLYLRFAVKKLRWVVGTCVSLASYIAAQAVLLPSQLPAWETSFRVKVFVGTLFVAVAMLIACVEFKVRRVRQTMRQDLKELGKAAGMK
jgi:hypothetical protein